MKHSCFDFDGKWLEIFGNAPKNGVWSIQGKEKHGKTAFTLSLVKYLSNFEKVLYVSAEEGTDALFVEACKRAEIPATNKIGFLPYITIEKLTEKLKQRNAARIVVIDNMTVYMDEFKRNGIVDFMRKHENILIIFISHEDRKEPATAAGRLVKKLAKIIMRIEGLQVFIGGRCPGGTMIIHDEKADLYGII
ncbi:MAG: hypothetical protein J0G96_07335 [Flavobacteriia bacterium]|nr:hypothetical protein [Flavobacteriia bacterium]